MRQSYDECEIISRESDAIEIYISEKTCSPGRGRLLVKMNLGNQGAGGGNFDDEMQCISME